MKLLSNAYHRDVISDVIDKTPDGKCLRELILSSAEMSTAFNFFMESIIVEYADNKVLLLDNKCQILGSYNFLRKDCRWLSHFFRNLVIETLSRRLNNTASIALLRKLCVSKNLLILDVLKLYRFWPKKSLLDDTSPRSIIINANQITEFKSLILRFEIVAIFNFGYNPDIYEQVVGFQSSNVVEPHFAILESWAYAFTDVVRFFKAEFKHVRKFIFMWRDQGGIYFGDNAENVKAVISSLNLLNSFRRPNIENVTIDVTTDFRFESSFRMPSNGIGQDFGTAIKIYYNWIVANVLQIPERISAKIDVTLNSSFEFDDEDPMVVLAPLLPAEQFEFKHEESVLKSSLIISNRQTQLRNNLELFFKCENFDRLLIPL